MRMMMVLRGADAADDVVLTALRSGVLLSLDVLDANDQPLVQRGEAHVLGNGNGNGARALLAPTPPGAPFPNGARVVARDAPKFGLRDGDAGRVTRIFRRGRGWAVDVVWDDDTETTVAAGVLMQEA